MNDNKNPYQRSENLIGRRFGKLIIIERASSDKDRNATWKCKCDCGNEKIVAGKYLKRGNNKSCGCMHTHPLGKAAFKKWFNLYLVGAKKRGLAFELSELDFGFIIKNPCTYCGVEPTLREHTKLNGGILMNGIDRVDSNLGYTHQNVVACCKICNIMKSNLSLSKFKMHIATVYTKLFA